MSTSLTIRWVFGYHTMTNKPFGLDRDEYREHGCNVEAVECMGGDSGSLVFARDSEVQMLNDRDGYDFDYPVFTLECLPPTAPFINTLNNFLSGVPEDLRPVNPPRWILHTDVG